MIHGVIFSLLRTYYLQNSLRSDFLHYARLLFQRHVTQGWDHAALKKIFLAAFKKLNQLIRSNAFANPPEKGPINNDDRAFFHMEFHPSDIPKGEIRKIYQEECEQLFKEELGVERFTIAYSRPKTIGSVIARTQLYQVEGKEVSKYFAGELP